MFDSASYSGYLLYSLVISQEKRELWLNWKEYISTQMSRYNRVSPRARLINTTSGLTVSFYNHYVYAIFLLIWFIISFKIPTKRPSRDGYRNISFRSPGETYWISPLCHLRETGDLSTFEWSESHFWGPFSRERRRSPLFPLTDRLAILWFFWTKWRHLLTIYFLSLIRYNPFDVIQLSF
jgi:hypothetical protein